MYGVGSTPEAALAEALSVGSPCESHDPREDHRPEDHFAVVPCTAAAFAWIEDHGGAPSRFVTVSHRGVMLRAEEEEA